MSGYRTLYRQSELTEYGSNEEPFPTFVAAFSPCIQTHLTQRSNAPISAPYRLLTSSADGIIRAYRIFDKESKQEILDASAVSVVLEQIMLQTSDTAYPKSFHDAKVSLGCAAISVIRNYVGEDTAAGPEIIAGMRFDGLVSIWKRNEQPLYPSVEDGNRPLESSPVITTPIVEFRVEDALGTTIKLINPTVSGYSSHGIVMCLGCVDGSIKMIASGVGIPDPRKCNDDSKCTEAGTVLDHVGAGNSVALSISLHPVHHLTFAVGRKNGIIDIFSSGRNMGADEIFGRFQRTHRLTHHSGAPVRSICFTPDGTLLISACDQGHIYIHDVSSFEKSQTIRMVAAILNAHTSYILSISSLPDSKRFLTCSADKTVKVWDISTPNSGPIHTFTGHDKIIWSLSSSLDGKRCVSVGDDGLLQIYSTDNM